jgi:sortase B
MLSIKELRRSTKRRTGAAGIWRWLRFLLLAFFGAGLIYSGIHIGGYLLDGKDEQQSLMDVRQTYAQMLENNPSVKTSDDSNDDAVMRNEASLKAFEALKEINADAVGWVTIYNTSIDHPVVQTSDNVYYLKHSFDGERSSRGCVFMDYRNSIDDRHIVFYGHHMKDGSMFGTLPLFEDPSYYEAHSDITINLRGTESHWKIFSVQIMDDGLMPVAFSDYSDFDSFIMSIKGASVYETGVNISDQDIVLSLSTCDDTSRERFVVHAKRIE